MAESRYARIVVKISGEALSGAFGTRIQAGDTL